MFISGFIIISSCSSVAAPGSSLNSINARKSNFSEIEAAEREDKNIELSAENLWEEFKDNQVGAEAKYVGKTIIIVGEIKNISTTIIKNLPHLELKVGFLKDIDCYFNKSDVEQLYDLRRNQKVRIKGKCKNHDTLVNCEVLNK
jgi:hypothetical protein